MAGERVKLGVVGGRRGAAFDSALAAFQERVALTAICDLSEAVLANWREAHPGIQTFNSYDDLLEKGDCTALYIATPMPLHAPQAIRALEAGKHVISEVIAATTLEECWQLVETVEKTGLVYMLAENCCYTEPNMMILNMVEQGVFGQMTYAEGAYIHDCRRLNFDPGGEITWRGQIRREINGNFYPTHSLGPVAQWLRVNREGGDRLLTTATWMTPAVAPQLHVREELGPDHPAAQDDYWLCGDSATTIIKTAKGAIIVLRKDSSSPRPHNTTHYVLQGSRAAYLSPRYHKDDPLIWIDGLSPGHSYDGAEWEPLWAYRDRYGHPRWRQWGEQARQTGHGGADFFPLEDFLDAIQKGVSPAIDVYDAATWSSIMPLSIESVARGSAPVAVPDFAARRSCPR